MPFYWVTIVQYVNIKTAEIDSAIEKKTAHLKTIQDKLDRYEVLLRRRNALNAISKQINENYNAPTSELRAMINSTIRSLIFEIDSENVAAEKEFNLKRKAVVENEVEFLKKRKQELIDIMNVFS